jgi:hypothetical protein
MNEEYGTEEDRRYAELTAGALADASDRTALANDLELWPPETELQRKGRAAIYRVWSLGQVR